MPSRKFKENHRKPKSISLEDDIWGDYKSLVSNYYPTYNLSSYIRKFILKTLKKNSYRALYQKYKNIEVEDEIID